MAERDTPTDRPPLGEELAGVTTVLVHSSGIGGVRASDSLPAFLPSGATLTETSVIVATYSQGAEAWLSDWRDAVGVLAARMLIVDATDGTRSTTQTATDGGQPSPGDHAIDHVSPDDLTGLGIALNGPLASWSDRPTVVSIDSLTAMLQYADLQRAFRFLHVLTRRVEAADARAVFYIDPDAHDDRTLATLAPLFDATVRADGPDGWTVDRG